MYKVTYYSSLWRVISSVFGDNIKRFWEEYQAYGEEYQVFGKGYKVYGEEYQAFLGKNIQARGRE